MCEELDYMSDEFLKSCVDGVNDVRPGLLRSHNDQRQHELLKKKNLELENKKKPIHVLQAEILEESLKQPIESTNKGFSMLEKMGFKSGMGLGKNYAGIKEPIEINIKNDKKGFGHRDCNRQRKSQKKKDKSKDMSEDNYRAFLSKKNKERECLSDFRKSQRICKELDLKSDKNAAEEAWFWPEEDTPDPQSDASDDDDNTEEPQLSNEEKLEMLTKYLREKYHYCVWCRVQYNDEKDLEDCPGATRDDH